jgi:hypothetical protein
MSKRFKSIIIISTALVILFGCEREKDKILNCMDDNEICNAQEYSIYSTVLNSLNSDTNSEFVLYDSTVFYDLSNCKDFIKSHLPDLFDATINNYQSISRHKVKILSIPDLELTCHLMNHDNISQWRAMYPNASALLQVSRVGFNSDKSQALVYFSEYSAPLDASGGLIFLQKEKNGWFIVKSLMIWIS